MKKQTNWDRYYKSQMDDPLTKRVVDDELGALRIGIQVAKLRQQKGLSQTQLAAKIGMSAPNISRIETDPSSNLTLNTLVKLFGALDCDVAIVTRPRRRKARTTKS